MKKIIKLNERDLTRIVKRVIMEQNDMIHIPTHYIGVRMELGLEDSDDANSDDIISLYNEIVEEGSRLVSYSGYGTEGKFYNEDDDEIPTDVILDELNYAIVGGKDEDEPIYAQKPFTDEEGNDILIPQIMDMLKPIYEESGTEGVVFFLSDLIDNIEDLGDEAFMGPKNY